jgi:hypothetical protein
MRLSRSVLTTAAALTTASTSIVAQAPASAAPRGWTAHVRTTGVPVKVRTAPTTAARTVAVLRDGSRIAVVCRRAGQAIRGDVRRSALWNRLTNGRYVSDAYTRWPSARRPAACVVARAKGRPGPAARRAALPRVSTGGGPANVRAEPSAAAVRLRRVANGAAIMVTCRTTGQYIHGHTRATAGWDRLSTGGYVSDANVRWAGVKRLPGSCPARLPGVRRDAARSQAAFIARVAGPARASMRRWHVPASVTIAQAILESGWGSSELASRDHNYFGTKCFGGAHGPIAVGCRIYRTSECDRTHCFTTRASFRVYRSMGDSLSDHARFLVVNERYKGAFAYARDADRFATAIHQAGYATSPTYARNLINLMSDHDLYRYDR